jgi:hypothetical protein
MRSRTADAARIVERGTKVLADRSPSEPKGRKPTFRNLIFCRPADGDRVFGTRGIFALEKNSARNLSKTSTFWGSGKTTITQLIPRLHDVRAGAVRVNGADVRETALNDVRNAE